MTPMTPMTTIAEGDAESVPTIELKRDAIERIVDPRRRRTMDRPNGNLRRKNQRNDNLDFTGKFFDKSSLDQC